MGIDTAWPAGSTAVSVLSPSLITVTLALSPFTVMAEILPLPFFGNEELTIRPAHAIRSLYRLVHPDIDRLRHFARGIYRDAVEIV
jgi:hypothetical protein